MDAIEVRCDGRLERTPEVSLTVLSQCHCHSHTLTANTLTLDMALASFVFQSRHKPPLILDTDCMY